MLFVVIYLSLNLLMSAFNALLGRHCLLMQTKPARSLGLTSMYSAMVVFSYAVSVVTWSEPLVYITSGICFMCIDMMLVCLTRFCYQYTDHNDTPLSRGVFIAVYTLAALDALVMLINPLWHIAITFTPIPESTLLVHYLYHPGFLYNVHLTFDYCLVAASVALLVDAMFTAPRGYRRRYGLFILGILVVVVINGLFLYFPKLKAWEYLDYSTMLYSLVVYFTYWNCFIYTRTGMLHEFRSWIFGNVDQGLALFDYKDRLLLSNRRMESIISQQVLQPGTTL